MEDEGKETDERLDWQIEFSLATYDIAIEDYRI